MVLESLFNPFTLKKRPWEMFLAGFFYSIMGLVLSFLVFRGGSSLLMVFLIVMATLPILYTTIKNEEEIDMKYHREWKLLQEHSKVIIFLLFLFLGITSALSLSYIFLPDPVVSTVFDMQVKAITNVNSQIHGQILGNVTRVTIFKKILLNNLKVLFFCLVFSFLYGAGAIFILTWNASVIAAAIGNLIKVEVAKTASVAGFSVVAAYFSAATFSFFRYMIHGLMEMAAYFVAGLAGSIISIALIKHNLQEQRVLTDTLDLIFISIGLLVVAGVVEVYVTPLLIL
jgi:uncharacterized membrane protein SpoIIM required for sporulation